MNTRNFFSCLSMRACIALSIPVLAVGCGGNTGNSKYSQNPYGLGPSSVSLSSNGSYYSAANDLGSAGNYVIMAKTGISNVTGSSVTGNIAVSPVAASYITGFGLVMDASNEFASSVSVVGNIYASDYSVPTPANLTSAIGSMETSYRDAAGRVLPDYNELATGNLGGLTLTPGLYKWTNTVTIPTTVTISGSSTDIWIFQISGDVVMDAGMSVILAGGAQAKNIFWQVAGQVTIGSTAHFEGIILCKTAITFQTGASLNGRAYAQTAVSLDNNMINQP